MNNKDKKTPYNPSRRATLRVKNPLPAPKICRFCSGNVRIGSHDEVYWRSYSEWPYVYICESCGSYVGLHPFTSIPLGTLADAETRKARKECKLPFEEIWRNGFMSRTGAYKWLAKEMGICEEECHFGWFDSDECIKAMRICFKKLDELMGGVIYE